MASGWPSRRLPVDRASPSNNLGRAALDHVLLDPYRWHVEFSFSTPLVAIPSTCEKLAQLANSYISSCLKIHLNALWYIVLISAKNLQLRACISSTDLSTRRQW